MPSCRGSPSTPPSRPPGAPSRVSRAAARALLHVPRPAARADHLGGQRLRFQPPGGRSCRRRNRRIELTAAGVRYLASVGDAIDRIHAGADELRADRGCKVVRLSAVPSFASSWLMPRIARFRELRPDIDVELETNADLVDFSIGEVHAGLRFGEGGWPGLVCERLFDVEVAPVCAPGLIPPSRAVSAEALYWFTERRAGARALGRLVQGRRPRWLQAQAVEDLRQRAGALRGRGGGDGPGLGGTHRSIPISRLAGLLRPSMRRP